MRRPVRINNFPKMFFRNIQIFQKFLEILFWEFAVITPHQRNPLFPGNMAVAYLMRRIRSATADAEFYKRQIIMEAVQAVVQTGIFGISTFRPSVFINRKTGMLLG